MISTCELAVAMEDENKLDETYSEGFKPMLAHSTICFETIMRLYYLHHGFEVPDGHMAHNLMVLAYKGLSKRNIATKEPEAVHAASLSDKEARSTLILAQKGLRDQGRNYFLPCALFQIVEMEMLPEDREALYDSVPTTREELETLHSREKYISSQYPVGLSKINTPPESRRLGALAKEFTDIAATKARLSSSGAVTSSSSSSDDPMV